MTTLTTMSCSMTFSTFSATKNRPPLVVPLRDQSRRSLISLCHRRRRHQTGRRGTARRFAIFPGRRENFEEKVSKEEEEEDEEDEEETMTMMSPFHHPQTTEK